MPLQFKSIAVGNLQDDVSGNNYAANKAVYILNLNNTLAQIFSDGAGVIPIVQDGVNNVTNSKGVFGFWVEAGDYFVQVGANKYRVSITGADYFNNRIDETVDLIVDAVAGRGAYYPVGSFEAGFTYTDINQVGTFGTAPNITYYVYTGGLTNLPHNVTAGTDPTLSSDYAQVFYGEIDNVQGLRDELNDRALYLTLAEAKAKTDLAVGQKVVITDRYNANSHVIPGTTNDELRNIALSNGYTLQVYQAGSAYVEHYGAVGGTDSTNAFLVAIANTSGKLHMAGTNYTVSQQLQTLNNCTGLVGLGEIDTRIIKNFDGDLIQSLNQGFVFEDFWIDDPSEGVGRDGGGLRMIADDCNVNRVRITGTRDAPIIFEADNAAYNNVDDCFLLARDDGFAIRGDGVDTITTPTVRNFSRLKGGGKLVNFAGMNRATLVGSFGTSIGFDASSDKISVSNVRLTCQDDVIIAGNSHTFSNNIFSFAGASKLYLANGAAGVAFDDSNSVAYGGNPFGGIIDLNPNGDVVSQNLLSTSRKDFTTVWGGSTSNGAFNNSSVVSAYTREGKVCTFDFSLFRGSTAVPPVGDWYVEAPFRALTTTYGTARIKSSSGTFNVGAAVVQGGSNKIYFYLHGQSAALNDATLAFGTGAQLDFSIQITLS